MARQFVNAAAAAQYLGISKSSLQHLCSENKIPYYRPNGGRVLFDLEELCRYVEASRVQPVTEAQSQAAAHCINQPPRPQY